MDRTHQKSVGKQPFPGEKRAAETANGRQKYRFPFSGRFPKRCLKKYPESIGRPAVKHRMGVELAIRRKW